MNIPEILFPLMFFLIKIHMTDEQLDITRMTIYPKISALSITLAKDTSQRNLCKAII